MNIGGLAMQAFGGAVKELDGKGKEDVRAVFRQVGFLKIFMYRDSCAKVQNVFRQTFFDTTVPTYIIYNFLVFDRVGSQNSFP